MPKHSGRRTLRWAAAAAATGALAFSGLTISPAAAEELPPPAVETTEAAAPLDETEPVAQDVAVDAELGDEEPSGPAHAAPGKAELAAGAEAPTESVLIEGLLETDVEAGSLEQLVDGAQPTAITALDELASVAEDAPDPALPPITGGEVTVTGEVKVGSELTASASGFSVEPASVDYAWSVDGVVTGTGASYTPARSDGGKQLTVRATPVLPGYLGTPAVWTDSVALAEFTGGAVTITGTAEAGNTLTAQPSAFSPEPTGYAYQWFRNGIPIDNANSSTYRVAWQDAEQLISVQISAQSIGFIGSPFVYSEPVNIAKTFGSQVLEIANTQLGVPYKLVPNPVPKGQSNPHFDCSSLTQWVFNQVGQYLPRTAAAQRDYLKQQGKQISKDERKLGDLMFTPSSTRGVTGHVGIYVDQDTVLDARQSGGVAVRDTNSWGNWTYYRVADEVYTPPPPVVEPILEETTQEPPAGDPPAEATTEVVESSAGEVETVAATTDAATAPVAEQNPTEIVTITAEVDLLVPATE